MTDLIRVRRALISVSDKSGLVAFARQLTALGVTLISTGGTAKALTAAGLDVTPIDQVTGFPEMMDGRVKTLHPRIHGGLLALRDNPEHQKAMAEHGIEAIDLVCVNLYPFEKTIAKPGVKEDEAIENIDIGGPSMVRSASKNHAFVAVVTDPAQYARVGAELTGHNGCTSLALRRELAAAAFARTAAYDAAIASWMSSHLASGTAPAPAKAPGNAPFPGHFDLHLERQAELRYGENPHQLAASYTWADAPSGEAGILGAQQLHGKELSFNNLFDASAALELIKEFSQPAAAVIKHTNPCGCGVAADLRQAFEKAYSGDPLAAFGGIVALNRPVDQATAQALTEGQKFLEVILAPSYAPDALELLRSRWQNVRLLATGPIAGPSERSPRAFDLKWIVGGALVQQRDLADMTPRNWQHKAGPALNPALAADLELAWITCKHVKSNAITIVREGTLVGAGAGQMDRVESCKIAVQKAQAKGDNRAQGAVAGSDAFFPFRDGPDTLIAAGVQAIVQPGGSKRDEETIQACNEAGVTLMFTGQRHFRH